MLDPLSFQSTVLVAVILAAAARTIIPYLTKRQNDINNGLTPRPFTISYILTALLGSVPVFVGAIMLLPIVLPQVSNDGTQLMVFVTAFGLAYATTDIVNRNIPTLGDATPALKARIAEDLARETKPKAKVAEVGEKFSFDNKLPAADTTTETTTTKTEVK